MLSFLQAQFHQPATGAGAGHNVRVDRFKISHRGVRDTGDECVQDRLRAANDRFAVVQQNRAGTAPVMSPSTVIPATRSKATPAYPVAFTDSRVENK